jgi:CheY-like chemotaxis protein
VRILVVDDKFESRWLVAGWLASFLPQVAIESAASADEALENIARRKPDLVLASHPMPEVDGLELARRIKAQPDSPTVVVMTDRTDAAFEAGCAAARADYCLEKRHLQAHLLRFLQERFSVKAVRQSFI